jgi:hypothetical protein
LLYEAPSATELVKETNISHSTVSNSQSIVSNSKSIVEVTDSASNIASNIEVPAVVLYLNPNLMDLPVKLIVDKVGDYTINDIKDLIIPF